MVMILRPSSLPMLAQCARFESGDSSLFAEAGSTRDAALEGVLNGKPDALDALDQDDADAVTWAAEYILLHAPTADYPLELKKRVNPLGDDFEPLFPATAGREPGGETDAVCGPHLFDLKSRERDYTAQMAAYALGLFELGYETVTVHLLFASLKRYQRYTLDEPAARRIVNDVIARVKSDAGPESCDYCGWCARQLVCPSKTGPAKVVAAGYAGEESLSKITSWHPSEMEDPEQIALGLYVWRTILKGWGESMEYHAREAALKRGVTILGFELKEKKGRSYVTDVARAHELTGLEASQFLSCCDVRMNTSKTHPDKLGVIDVYSKVKQLPKAAAKRQITKILEPVITTGKPTISLVSTGDTDNSDFE